ncbi:MAG: Phosphatidate cytidylyltransferase [Firmicutes bacterium ADurb.Bin182]|nr:MAG: Phosphatidate cytidylyltransferase [Firmicutes bacterium ADurb.Bin182]
MLTRIIVGLLLIVILAALLYFGGIFQSVVYSLAAVLSVFEMGYVMRAKGYRPLLPAVYLFAASFFAVNEYFGTSAMLFLLSLCVVFTIAVKILNKKSSAEDCFFALFTFIYPMLFYVFLMLVSTIQERALRLTATLIMFAGPLMGDTMAYFVGVLFGRHKLCPDISPKKTIEGGIAGVFGGLLGGLLVFILQDSWNGTVSVIHLSLIGLLCGFLGQVGDLFASSIKRWAGVKDFGSIFPGHGGVMDRLDSVLFCAPVIFVYFFVIYM